MKFFKTTDQELHENKVVYDELMIVCRYELPGINGLNFVLKNSLGGGGISSLNYDPQVRVCQEGQIWLVYWYKCSY